MSRYFASTCYYDIILRLYACFHRILNCQRAPDLGAECKVGGDFGEFLSKKGRPLSEVISSRLKGSNTERKIYACRQSERMVVG